MRTHIAMEDKAPTLRVIINHLHRAQSLAPRLVRGLRHVPYEERLCRLNFFSLERRLLRANLILAFKIFKGEVVLNSPDFFLRPPPAAPPHRRLAHLVLSPSVSFFKKQLDRQWSELFPATPVQFPSPFVYNFLNTVTPDYLCLPIPPIPDQLMWF